MIFGIRDPCRNSWIFVLFSKIRFLRNGKKLNTYKVGHVCLIFNKRNSFVKYYHIVSFSLNEKLYFFDILWLLLDFLEFFCFIWRSNPKTYIDKISLTQPVYYFFLTAVTFSLSKGHWFAIALLKVEIKTCKKKKKTKTSGDSLFH